MSGSRSLVGVNPAEFKDFVDFADLDIFLALLADLALLDFFFTGCR
jgi:hypothetical protein